MSCRGFLQCILKLLNMVLMLVGALMVLYGLWMLKEWHETEVPSLAPSPAPVEETFNSLLEVVGSATEALELPLKIEVVESPGRRMGGLSFVMEPGRKMELGGFPDSLPSPWFIYAFLAAGILACLTTCAGHIAAETTSSCCLCCYTLLLAFLLILQAVATAVIFFDARWKDDIPNDPTGQLDKMSQFVLANYKICKWTGVAVLIVEALALLLSLTLRALSVPRKSGYDSDDEYVPRNRQATMNRQATTAGNGAAGDAPAENRPARSDEWSKRMREKYGLDTNEFTYDPSEARRYGGGAGTAAATEEKKGGCSIM